MGRNVSGIIKGPDPILHIDDLRFTLIAVSSHTANNLPILVAI